jgi:hypothetical protein
MRPMNGGSDYPLISIIMCQYPTLIDIIVDYYHIHIINDFFYKNEIDMWEFQCGRCPHFQKDREKHKDAWVGSLKAADFTMDMLISLVMLDE